MEKAFILAASMVRFGKYPDRSVASLGREAVEAVLADSGVAPGAIEAVFCGRSFGGAIDGQVSVPGQVALQGTGIEDVPVFNLDNACAAAASALHLAVQSVRTGQYGMVLVVGMDRLFADDRRQSMRALFGAMDVEKMAWIGEAIEGDGPVGSVFMDNYYARVARQYLADTGATPQDYAQVAVKNRRHAGANPFAQYRKPLTVDEVMGSPMVAEPLRALMCSPLTDGAAAMIVCSRAARQAYDEAGIGPQDVDVLEVHDASAVAELIATEEICLAPRGHGLRMLRDGTTSLGGAMPVNPSGGLLSRGHPGAATGASQLVELVWQLQERADGRQVEAPRHALAHSAGGAVGDEPGAIAITILARN